jgi:hypothetical protein
MIPSVLGHPSYAAPVGADTPGQVGGATGLYWTECSCLLLVE